VLFVNDYDILTGHMVGRYADQIDGFLKEGIPLGGIGVQGHIHGDTFDPDALRKSLDTLARFRLPIRITEFNMPGQRFSRSRRLRLTPQEEEKKAQALADYYRICFAHPAVEGILMWGFWEGANWIPASSLFARDWTPTPAAHAYRKLVYETWWTRWKGTADAEGRCEVRAFYGTHLVRSNGKSAEVALEKKRGAAAVDLR
jgi:GH35 family endo-1,4-beta-xylanase